MNCEPLCGENETGDGASLPRWRAVLGVGGNARPILLVDGRAAQDPCTAGEGTIAAVVGARRGAQVWTNGEVRTSDSVMQQHRFCNVFRVFDRVTQYLIHNVIENGDQDPRETMFRIILFRFFNRVETWGAPRSCIRRN